MTRFRVIHLLPALLAISLAAGAPATGTAQDEPDRFYLEMEASGRRAEARGDYDAAARDFRLAAFGLLDYPNRLAEVLARLLRAQAEIGDDQGLRDTLVRLDEVESRFRAVRRANFPSELAAAIERYTAALLSPEERATIPLVAPAPASMAPPAISETSPATATIDGATTIDVALSGAAIDAGLADEAVEGGLAGHRPDETAEHRPDEGVEVRDSMQRNGSELDEALRAGSAARSPAEIRAALAKATEIADSDPAWPEAQLVAARLAYRASDWQAALRFFDRAGEIDTNRPTLHFYRAVALYETGRIEAARESLARSLDGLERSPLVDAYLRKIMGS